VTATAEHRGAGRRSPARSALRRIWNAGAWLPVLADRPGLRWLLSGRLVGAPIVILTHRGRRSGMLYRTPVEAIVEDDAAGEVVVSPMRGRRGDWFLNVLAGGLVEVTLRGERFKPEWRELSESENREALTRYRGEHPIYGRAVLWALARLHGVDGDTLPAVARTVPMLALKRPPTAE
jgi:deazaflavin-dependent oxidoreductase (nitroreductase family)